MSISQPRLIGAICAAGVVAFAAGYALAAQPHMTAALNDLRAARSQLEAATADKAGHRIAAIGLVDQAIQQVRDGIVAGAF